MKTRYQALVAGVLAAASLAVFFDSREDNGNAPTPVLVANRFISAGTLGHRVQEQQGVTLTTLPRRQVEDGAISNPPDLRGRIAAVDIYPGQQLTDVNVPND